MQLSDSDRAALSSLEQQFTAHDSKFAKRFSKAHRELDRRRTSRGPHGWRVGVGIWLAGLVELLITLQGPLLWPLLGVVAMLVGNLRVARWLRSGAGRVARNDFVNRHN